jgi:SAM-dependent methyltransferase
MTSFIKQSIRKGISQLGYEVRKIDRPPAPAVQTQAGSSVQPIEPIWPLPRHSGGPSDDEIRAAFARYEFWHYAYQFDGGLAFAARHTDVNELADAPERPLQRFRHFMPDLVASQGGSLRGKRVLDIACNSGFWSIQCALLGAEVVGFDARAILIEQANLIKSIAGVENVSFQQLDFWSMSPQTLGGTFDVVLNLGLLYHLPEPLEVLQRTRQMCHDTILLDTSLQNNPGPIIDLRWEESADIRAASNRGIVAYPSRKAIDLMLRHLGMRDWYEIPIRTRDMPPDYLDGSRASWLIHR